MRTRERQRARAGSGATPEGRILVRVAVPQMATGESMPPRPARASHGRVAFGWGHARLQRPYPRVYRSRDGTRRRRLCWNRDVDRWTHWRIESLVRLRLQVVDRGQPG